MKKSVKNKLAGYGIAGVLILAIMAVLFGISWIVTCGVIKLITICFGLEFSWRIATGIWLVMCLAGTVFKSTTTVKK